MVILIGAESLTGKTLMAQKLLEIYKMPYISADHIKMGLYRANGNCGFTPDDGNDVIEERLWPVLRGIAETNIENGQSVIIEGCYIYPHRISELSSFYTKNIIPVFMGFSDEYLEANFVSRVLRYRNAIESRKEKEDRTLGWFIAANEKMKAMCAKNNMPYFEIRGDYDKDTGKIYEWIAAKSQKIKTGFGT